MFINIQKYTLIQSLLPWSTPLTNIQYHSNLQSPKPFSMNGNKCTLTNILSHMLRKNCKSQMAVNVKVWEIVRDTLRNEYLVLFCYIQISVTHLHLMYWWSKQIKGTCSVWVFESALGTIIGHQPLWSGMFTNWQKKVLKSTFQSLSASLSDKCFSSKRCT